MTRGQVALRVFGPRNLGFPGGKCRYIAVDSLLPIPYNDLVTTHRARGFPCQI